MSRRRNRVNLIPPELRTAGIEWNKLIPAAVATVVFFWMAITAARVSWEQGRLEEQKVLLETRKSEIRERIDLLTARQNRYEAFKNRSDLVNGLVSRKIYWSESFKELSLLMPASLWMNQLVAVSKDGAKSMSLDGSADASEAVSTFLLSLEKSYFFRRVTMAFTERDDATIPSLYKFKLVIPVGEGLLR